MKKNIILILVSVVVLSGLSACTVKPAANTVVDNSTDNSVKGEQTVVLPTVSKWEGLAKALTAAGAKMYGAYWCSHCKNQEEMFGDAFKYVTYIESADAKDPYKQTPAAIAAGIQGYPTWIFADGSRVESEMTFDELAKKINYTPPK